MAVGLKARSIALAVTLAAVSLAPEALEAEALPGTELSFSIVPRDALADARAGFLELRVPGPNIRLHLAPNPLAQDATFGHGQTPVGTITETVTFEGAARLPTGEIYPVRIAATALGLLGVIFAPDALHIQPRWLNEPGAPPDLHQIVPASELPLASPEHPEPEIATPGQPSLPALPLRSTTGSQDANRVVRFLIESDFEFYKRFSLNGECASCVFHSQQAVMNVAEFLFESQTGVSFQITSQWVCTTVAECSYPSLAFSGGAWLSAFMEKWEASTLEPPHELGHLLVATDLPLMAGTAGTGVVGTTYGYALSEILAWDGPDEFNFIRYSTPAHEIGHNFDAVHAEADPSPPSIYHPNIPRGFVWTIMASSEDVRYEFSDGNQQTDHNNVARIVQHAIAQLPEP